MRFVVTQMGGRRGYAVPAILEKAGMLESFYTDIATNVGLGKWFCRCASLLGWRHPGLRSTIRRIPEGILSKTTTFPWLSARQIARGLIAEDPRKRFRRRLQTSRELGKAVANRGFGNATHLYSMLGEFGPVLREANEQGLVTVTEIYILLSTEGIVAQERERFAQWEPSHANLEAIRDEFCEQKSLLIDTHYAICPSEVVRSDLVQNFGFSSKHTSIVPYGIESSRLKMAAQPRPGRVLFAGTAGLRKGIHHLAQAAQSLHRKGRGYQFRIAGETNKQVRDQTESRHLQFLGRLSREELCKEYASADVFAFPSLAEGSAEVIYEAIAAGLPVITTKASGSVVRDDQEGFIVPERDPAALGSALEQIIEDRNLRDRFSRQARCRAEEYTLERYADRLVNTLQALQ